MCDWRKLPRRVTSRPEIEISDKRLAFSSQTSSIEPSYKTGPKQVKISISRKVQGFLKKFRVQNVALTVRVAFLFRGRWVTVPPTPLGVPTYLQKCTTSVVRGHPPTYRKVRHSVNLVLNLVLRSMHTKFSTVVGGTHLPTQMYDISRSGGPTHLQKCMKVAP